MRNPRWLLVAAGTLGLAYTVHAAAISPTAINGAPGHVVWVAAINDTVSPPTQAQILTAPFSAESTGVLAVSMLRSCAIRLQAWPAGGDTSSALRFEVLVKALQSSTVDTLTSAHWTRLSTSTAATDSTLTSYGLGTGVRLGGIAVPFDNRHYLPSAFRDWAGGNAKWIMLWGTRGEQWNAPFMQIVVRNTGPLGAGKPRIRLDVIGQRQ